MEKEYIYEFENYRSFPNRDIFEKDTVEFLGDKLKVSRVLATDEDGRIFDGLKIEPAVEMTSKKWNKKIDKFLMFEEFYSWPLPPIAKITRYGSGKPLPPEEEFKA